MISGFIEARTEVFARVTGQPPKRACNVTSMSQDQGGTARASQKNRYQTVAQLAADHLT